MEPDENVTQKRRTPSFREIVVASAWAIGMSGLFVFAVFCSYLATPLNERAGMAGFAVLARFVRDCTLFGTVGFVLGLALRILVVSRRNK